MTLTVPRAGIGAGRAPGIELDTDQTGAVVADFGARLAQTGERILGEALDRQATRLRIDMTRALGEARLEFEQMNDPDRIDAEWPERVRAMRSRFLAGEDGRPVHPRLQERVGLAFDELANRHGLALGERAIAARRNQREANWIAYSSEVLTQSRTVDRDTRETLLEQAVAQVNDDLAAGHITPVEAVSRKLELRENAARTAALQMVDADPQGFLDATDGGQFDDLPPDDVERYRGRAQTNIERQAKAAQDDAEEAQKARDREIGDRLDLISDIAGKDLVTAGETDFLASPGARAHPKWPEAMAAVRLRDEIPDLATLTPEEIRAELDKARAEPKTAEFQAGRVAVLERLLGETEKGWAGDGVSYAAERGFRVPELPAFDPGNPAGFERGLRDRLSFAARAVAEGYTETPPILSEAERKALGEMVQPDADPAQRAALARSIWRATDGRAGPVVRSIGGDEVFAHAAGLIGATGSTAMAERIFAGQQKIANKTVNLPSHRDQVIVFDELTEGLFEGQPGVKAQVMAVAQALYADGAAGIDPDELTGGRFRDGDAREIFERSVQLALGAAPDADGNLTVGGLQELSTGLTELPPGVARRTADAAIDKVERQLRGATWDGRVENWTFTDPDADRFRALKAASRSGAAPDLGDTPYERWAEVRMVPIGNDLYKLTWDAGNGLVFDIPDDTGARFEFSLRKLIGAPR